MNRYLLLLVLLSVTFCGKIKGNTSNNDSIQVSLITCAPGDQIYTLFGHTAIRVNIPSENYDVVYNYGIFDFNSENFIWRFALGETDYILGKYYFHDFLKEYITSNRSVWEQQINISNAEKLKLIQSLEENALPQNRVYRYNYFYDNCATRPFKKISESTNNAIQLNDNDSTIYSFRDIVHRYTNENPWSQFGIDLCLGSQADEKIGIYEKIFVPIELMNAIDFSNPTNLNLFGSIETIYPSEQGLNTTNILNTLTPLLIFSLLLIIIGILSFIEYRRKKVFWGIDALLFPLYGIAGCILAFISLISVHPTVSPNYILFLFHPFHLIFAPYIIKGEIKETKIWYHTINVIVLTLFLVGNPIIPQSFDLSVLILASILWLRSMTYIVIRRYNKQ